MVSPTKCVMLLAFFLGLVLNVAGVPAHGESCECEGAAICVGVCEGNWLCSNIDNETGTELVGHFCQ